MICSAPIARTILQIGGRKMNEQLALCLAGGFVVGWFFVAFIWVSILVRQSIENRYTASQSKSLNEDGA